MIPPMRALSVTKQGGVAEVELLGPGKGNAMGPDFWAECPGVFRDLDKDDDVRAVIVRGSGKHFSFGLDLMGMMEQLAPHLMGSPSAKQRTKLLDYIAELQASTNAVAECRKPVIAAVHGACIGGGVDLISACDVRLASQDAYFSIREVKVGMVAGSHPSFVLFFFVDFVGRSWNAATNLQDHERFKCKSDGVFWRRFRFSLFSLFSFSS